ncbi:MAG: YceI family protein [Candidatus Kuenenia sp.]|nr:YceI family protein [Candidatus Kuenenia hertensis]
MSIKTGMYSFDENSGKIQVYTFKEGMLSAVAHDLLLDVTHFKVDLNIPSDDLASATINAEISSNSLKVVSAMKDGLQQNDTLKEKDKSEIEEATNNDVLHSKKYPTINFQSTSICKNNGSYHVAGKLTLHGVTTTIEFDCETAGENMLKGSVDLMQKDYGIKPYKALLGTLKVKNNITIAFSFSLK